MLKIKMIQDEFTKGNFCKFDRYLSFGNTPRSEYDAAECFSDDILKCFS